MGGNNLMAYTIYLQDKRARKRIPANGTKKYPMIYIGVGVVEGNRITVDNANGLYVVSAGAREGKGRYRAFCIDDNDTGVWIDNPNFDLLWKPV